MIEVKIVRTKQNKIGAFTVKNHGESYVCAAVSMLVINTINCIEHFVGEPMLLDVNQDGAFISCSFPRASDGLVSYEADLLLNTMLFGLNDVLKEHKKDIIIEEVSI